METYQSKVFTKTCFVASFFVYRRSRIIDRNRIKELEPIIADGVECALYAPTGSIVCPYELAVADVGNAMDNGAELLAKKGKDSYVQRRLNMMHNVDIVVVVGGFAGMCAAVAASRAGVRDILFNATEKNRCL